MKTEQELQQRLAVLPDSIEPPRDLWPELAARLAQTPQQPAVEPISNLASEQSSHQTAWWLAAAAVVLLAWWGPWQPSAEPPLLVQQTIGDSATATQEGFIYSGYLGGFETGLARRGEPSSETQWRLCSEFEQQRALQLAKITQVPEIYQDWQQQLQIWKQATNLVLLALQYQPDEPGLLRQLSKLQQQEIAYLQKVVLADQT